MSIDSGNLSPENVREIATRLDVKEGEVVDMENRLLPDQSLNIRIVKKMIQSGKI